MNRIDCFVPAHSNLQSSELVNSINIVNDSFTSTHTIKQIAREAKAEYTLVYTKQTPLSLGYFALERMVRLADDSGAAMVYADHYQVQGEKRVATPLIAYQKGSLRDDFNFGAVLLFRTEFLKQAAAEMVENYCAAGLYDLRLRVSRLGSLVHINEYLYSEIESDDRKSGQKIFDYADPKNRASQIEMESACTAHLKAIGAYLEPNFTQIEFSQGDFQVEASVIIPVYNRVRTIRDAVASVLSQKTSFEFNLIVIDNHSTDGTTEVIAEFAADARLIHIIPDRTDLGIGGCWNVGAHHPKCGRFAVQLDSDDIYSSEHTLQTIVNAFYQQNCAMVVGTYMMTDFDMNMVAPGVIDHREWTPENGRNNALRINGLGAPRAFYTPLLREIKVPNTSYGEDYALGLAFSRHYQIGRIYDVIYHCRRWEGNSDAALDVVKMNAHNLYKDRIRTWEVEARQKINSTK